MVELGGMLASAILKVVSDQIGSAIGGRIKLHKDFSKDLGKMKMALESVEAVLEDAERRSITDKSTRLWLKRLKEAMYAISDMIDEFEADMEAVSQASKRKLTLREHLSVMIPCFPTGAKIALAYKMKMMREDLEEITGDHKNFNLLPGINANDLYVIDKRETSSNIDTQIVGRTGERDAILAFLSESITNEMTILSIYGIGGLGKTTLAQMVYNSSQFKDYSHVWVYVSQTFDLKKIGNSIISQLSEKEKETHYTEMQMIHKSLSKLLADKKILIVLDDLWENKKSDLNKLKAMLHVGKGSKVVVVVTTRDEGIAKEISTAQPHKLALLTNDMCWSIIKHKSGFKSRDDKNELKHIGKDIARKCGGVVLAAQSLGYMLQTMTSREWESVRDSGIWSISDSEESSSTHVLASLRLSYSVMPSYLKLCFAYCAIYPKGHKIVKADLIHQWASLGLIEPTNVSSSWELGERYIRQLLGLSFLQDSNLPLTAGVNIDDDTFYTMHDLVHDLARSIMVDEIFVASKENLVHALGSNCHYALLNDCSKPLESSKIRALRFVDCGEVGLHHTAFTSAKCLRVLDLSECSICKLSDSIGLLKQLRYLNAPRVQDAVIPKSITRLSKLIYLNLRGSTAILALPKSIGEIEGLMYLDLSGCSGIEELPESLGRHKNLVHLDLSNCSHVGNVSKFLGSLTNLQYLNLSYCTNIGELPGGLASLSKLQYLNLSFSSYVELCEEADVLGSLTELGYLNLASECCCVQNLPEALGSFIKLKYLNLSGWRELEELPRLFGNLTNLVQLSLSNCTMCCVSGQTDSFMGRISALPNLEHLDLSYNSSIFSIPHSLCNLRKLHTLDLSHCSHLEEIPESIGTVDSLKFLYLNGCDNMQCSISGTAKSLSRIVVHVGHYDDYLNITRLENVKSTQEAHRMKLMEKQGLEDLKLEWTTDAKRFVDDKVLLEKLVPPSNLQKLEIQGYNGVNFPAWLMGGLPKLKWLVLRDLKRMEGWNTSYSSGAYVIELLEIHDCPKLRLMPLLPRAIELKISNSGNVLSSWGECTSASSSSSIVTTKLEVEHCEVPLHQWRLLRHLPGLKFLRINDCDDLTGSPEIIQHLSSLETLLIVGSSGLKELHESMRLLTKLQWLQLCGWNSMTTLPEWLGDLTSLEKLAIWDCDVLRSLPESIQQLTNLQELKIHSCPELEQWCESNENQMKLAHIQIKDIGFKFY